MRKERARMNENERIGGKEMEKKGKERSRSKEGEENE